MYFRNHTGGEMIQVNSQAISDDVRKQLYHHTDSMMCCTIKMNVSFCMLLLQDELEAEPEELEE